LPICPESEYYHQNGNFGPQHSTKLIDVTQVLAFRFNAKTGFSQQWLQIQALFEQLSGMKGLNPRHQN